VTFPVTLPETFPADIAALAEQGPDDVDLILIAWLTPQRRTAGERVAGDVLPMTMVVHVAGGENVDEGTAAPIVSVHTFTDKALGRLNCNNETRATHERVLRLAVHCDTVVLPDGRQCGVDYVDVVESPLWMPYGDEQILRKVGRYEVGLTYVPT
jgi:hypothetical protein